MRGFAGCVDLGDQGDVAVVFIVAVVLIVALVLIVAVVVIVGGPGIEK